jgi:chromosome segregation ATPase
MEEKRKLVAELDAYTRACVEAEKKLCDYKLEAEQSYKTLLAERDEALAELKRHQEQLSQVWQAINRGQAENERLKSERDEALAEVKRQKTCIVGLTEQCAALVVEKNSLLMDHGGALCDQAKIEMLETMLAETDALLTGLKTDVEEMKSALREARSNIEKSRSVFDQYVTLHLDKTPPDGEKAARNAFHRGICDQAIATINATLGEE